ncbi:MAG: M56 family metallopeptidase, partial [Gorillibacterium sp.]|nr:M56 family metallopeptidase [Gorillibacterium sp.]
MTGLFTTFLNMSITATYVSLGVIVLRMLLQKGNVPRIFSYALWLAVWIRLIFPFTFNSSFSLFSLLKLNHQTSTGAIEYIPRNIGFMQVPAIDVGNGMINGIVNSSLPPATVYGSINSLQITMGLASIIW